MFEELAALDACETAARIKEEHRAGDLGKDIERKAVARVVQVVVAAGLLGFQV